MNIIIFGPPGAGKGTQSEFIVEKFNLFKLSTGDLLRDEINKKTVLGLKIKTIVNSGSLVSDDIINSLIEIIVSNKDYKKIRKVKQKKRKDKLTEKIKSFF